MILSQSLIGKLFELQMNIVFQPRPHPVWRPSRRSMIPPVDQPPHRLEDRQPNSSLPLWSTRMICELRWLIHLFPLPCNFKVNKVRKIKKKRSVGRIDYELAVVVVRIGWSFLHCESVIIFPSLQNSVCSSALTNEEHEHAEQIGYRSE